jgi:hypothetical protein
MRIKCVLPDSAVIPLGEAMRRLVEQLYFFGHLERILNR